MCCDGVLPCSSVVVLLCVRAYILFVVFDCCIALCCVFLFLRCGVVLFYSIVCDVVLFVWLCAGMIMWLSVCVLLFLL